MHQLCKSLWSAAQVFTFVFTKPIYFDQLSYSRLISSTGLDGVHTHRPLAWLCPVRVTTSAPLNVCYCPQSAYAIQTFKVGILRVYSAVYSSSLVGGYAPLSLLTR